MIAKVIDGFHSISKIHSNIFGSQFTAQGYAFFLINKGYTCRWMARDRKTIGLRMAFKNFLLGNSKI
jgi:hypothetical protein